MSEESKLGEEKSEVKSELPTPETELPESRTEIEQIKREIENMSPDQIAEMILALKTENEVLKQLSEIDDLTGLLNKRGWGRALSEAAASITRHRDPFATMIVDLDGFKGINDTFGHKTGDDALKMVSEVLRVSLRPEDKVARTGGDEFSLLVTGLNEENAEMVRARIDTNIQRRIAELTPGHPLYDALVVKRARFGASVGMSHTTWTPELSAMVDSWSTSEFDDESKHLLNESIGEADRKMYEVKEQRKLDGRAPER